MLCGAGAKQDAFVGSAPGNVSCTWCHLSSTCQWGRLGTPGIAQCPLELFSDMRHLFSLLHGSACEEPCPKMSGSRPPLKLLPCLIYRDLWLQTSGLCLADSTENCPCLPCFPEALPHYLSSWLFWSPRNLLWLILLWDQVKLISWSTHLAFLHTSLIHSTDVYCDPAENLIQGILRTEPALKECLIQWGHTVAIQCDRCHSRRTIIKVSTYTKLIFPNILFPPGKCRVFFNRSSSHHLLTFLLSALHAFLYGVAIISSILLLRKLGHWKVKRVAQNHTVGEVIAMIYI